MRSSGLDVTKGLSSLDIDLLGRQQANRLRRQARNQRPGRDDHAGRDDGSCGDEGILSHDRWRFDPARRRLIGEISHTEYHLGQEIDVVIQAVNIERRFLDLAPVQDIAPSRSKRRAKKPPSPKPRRKH